MKKAKLIPSFLIIILSVAVLCMGVYAINPTTHSITGTINVTAGGALIDMQAFMGGEEYSDPVSARNESKSVNLKTPVTFNCEDAYDASGVDPQTLVLRITNKASTSLGVYFVETEYNAEGKAQATSTKTTMQYLNATVNGTGNVVERVVKAGFPDYTEIPGKDYVDLEIDLTLLVVGDSAMTAKIDFFLVVEEYAKEKIPENTIVFSTNDLDVEATCTLESAATNPAAVVLSANDSEWTVENLAFSEETYDSELLLQPIKMKMLIENNEDFPVKATIKNYADVVTERIRVHTVDNAYIEPNSTGEVSIYFSAIYDRVAEDLTDISVFDIPDFGFKVSIEQTSELTNADLLAKVHYDETGKDGCHFYIEYGTNPYYNAKEAASQGDAYIHSPKLRWFIYKKYEL